MLRKAHKLQWLTDKGWDSVIVWNIKPDLTDDFIESKLRESQREFYGRELLGWELIEIERGVRY